MTPPTRPCPSACSRSYRPCLAPSRSRPSLSTFRCWRSRDRYRCAARLSAGDRIGPTATTSVASPTCPGRGDPSVCACGCAACAALISSARAVPSANPAGGCRPACPTLAAASGCSASFQPRARRGTRRAAGPRLGVPCQPIHVPAHGPGRADAGRTVTSRDRHRRVGVAARAALRHDHHRPGTKSHRGPPARSRRRGGRRLAAAPSRGRDRRPRSGRGVCRGRPAGRARGDACPRSMAPAAQPGRGPAGSDHRPARRDPVGGSHARRRTSRDVSGRAEPRSLGHGCRPAQTGTAPRRAWHAELPRIHAAGASVASLARQLDLDRKTVRR